MKYDVVIIGGFGHVGLPMGIVLADAGLKVGLYDINADFRASIESGQMPFTEYGAEELLQRNIGETLFVVDDITECKQADYVIVTIGTPVDEYRNPKLDSILNLADDLIDHLRDDQCLILRSTVYPGTTRRLSQFFNQNNKNVHISYCPERIVQGHAVKELRELPQIVSGFNVETVKLASDLFTKIGVATVDVSVEEAELAKLYSNTWRYIQFAITNQFFMMATDFGADYKNVLHAMTFQYERAKDFPGPGFTAGPCLLKDTLQLSAFYNDNFQLGHAAMLVNEGLPSYIVRMLQGEGVELAGQKVGILGMAFKSGIDDTRDSLSYKLAKVLKFNGAEVLCSDDFVKGPNLISKEELVDLCSIIIVGVPHPEYRSLKIPPSKRLVDLWSIVPID